MFFPVRLHFVDVLAEDDRGYAKRVHRAGDDDIPIP
jgi:hypothetical protein